jgi:hypothetical protein
MILYHGTTKKALDRILKEGIKPRESRESNWEGHGVSRQDLVYLSDCYAPYYAFSACKNKKDKGVIIKVKIEQGKIKLYPDEEAIFNAIFREKVESGKIQNVYNNIDPKDYQRLMVNGKETEGWKASLDYMGVVTTDFVPKECIVGYYIEKDGLEFVLNCDPVVNPLNYKLCGQSYRDYIDSLKFIKVA